MLFYVVLLVVVVALVGLAYKVPKTATPVSLLLLLGMVVIGGFRDSIGWDYEWYSNWYLRGTRDAGLEFGFLALMQLFRHWQLAVPVLFFVVAFLTYLAVYLGVKKYSTTSSLPLVLYLLIPSLFIGSFTLIRQLLAVALAFYAFAFLLEKKKGPFFILMAVAVSFHYSALVPLVVFLVVYQWGNRIAPQHLYWLLAVTFCIGQLGVIALLSGLLEGSHYHFYVAQQFAVPVPFLKLAIFNTMGILVIFFYNQKGFPVPNRNPVLVLYIVGIGFLNAFAESSDLTRLYIYFRIFEIILMADIMYWLLAKKRHVLLGLVCCFYILPYFRAIKMDYETGPEGLKMIPYKSLLVK